MAIDFSRLPPAAGAGGGSTAAPPRCACRRCCFALQGRIGARERMLFTERLALLLETGVSLHEALEGPAQADRRPAPGADHPGAVRRILEGQPLSAALAAHPAMFSPTYVNLVAAAEEGGFLPEVLQQLIEMDEKTERMRSMLVVGAVVSGLPDLLFRRDGGLRAGQRVSEVLGDVRAHPLASCRCRRWC